MLTRSTRDQYTTLLDAITLTASDAAAPALIYVASDAAPITISRAAFRDHTRRYAAALHSMGIHPGDLVIIAHTQSLGSIFAFWGAMLLGAIPSMFPTLTEKLDPAVYMRNMNELVRSSDVRCILTTDDFALTLSEQAPCPVYGSQTLIASLQNADDAIPTFTPESEAVAFLQHSSGTTGLQKGVALSHQAVLNQLASYADALRLDNRDVIVSWLPLYHDMGLIAAFIQPLVQGIPLVLMSPFDWVTHPALLLRTIQDYQGTLCWLPNFAYNHCAQRIRQRDSDGLDLSSMRAFINCSEPVFDTSHQRFAERFAANGVTLDMLTVSYAMAENTFAVTQTSPGTYPTVDVVDRVALQNEQKAVLIAPDAPTASAQVSCGKPIAGTQVKVVDDAGQSLPERHLGEILVKSDCMLTGYYKRDDLQPFDADGWYRTGDRGYLCNGEIYIAGRSKDLIINAGKNIYPQDLETLVNTIDGVHPGRVVVFGVPDAREGTELIALVAEVDSDDPARRKQIMQTIRQTVGRQTEITLNFVELVERGWLIKTSSGKIARSQNRDKWQAQRDT